MADFCRQCSEELFGEDYPERKHHNDFEGIISKEQYEAGECAIGICEGCGGGEFDHTGLCLGCDEHEYVPPKEIV